MNTKIIRSAALCALSASLLAGSAARAETTDHEVTYAAVSLEVTCEDQDGPLLYVIYDVALAGGAFPEDALVPAAMELGQVIDALNINQPVAPELEALIEPLFGALHEGLRAGLSAYPEKVCVERLGGCAPKLPVLVTLADEDFARVVDVHAEQDCGTMEIEVPLEFHLGELLGDKPKHLDRSDLVAAISLQPASGLGTIKLSLGAEVASPGASLACVVTSSTALLMQ